MERESDYARIKLLVGYIAFPDDGWLADAKAQTTDVRALCNPLHVCTVQPLACEHAATALCTRALAVHPLRAVRRSLCLVGSDSSSRRC